MFNIDLGLNFRLLDFKASIDQKETGIKESQSYFLPIPMIYAGVQIEPFEYAALEFEGRGIGWSSNYYVTRYRLELQLLCKPDWKIEDKALRTFFCCRWLSIR
jgi:hypothetical protein